MVMDKEGMVIMKYLLLAILGAILGWIVLSLILQDWDSQGLIILIIGIFVGYYTRKETEDKAK